MPHRISIARTKICGAPGCTRPARPGGRTCPACNAAAFRRWYKRHHADIKADRHVADAQRTAEQRARDCARAKLAMAIKRGKIVREPCAHCKDPKVAAFIPDPANWKTFLWLCRECRAAEIDRRATPTPEQIAAAWNLRRDAALAAIAALPETERSRLQAIAARGPAGLRLSPEAPLYTMRLVQAYEAAIAPKSDSPPA